MKRCKNCDHTMLNADDICYRCDHWVNPRAVVRGWDEDEFGWRTHYSDAQRASALAQLGHKLLARAVFGRDASATEL